MAKRIPTPEQQGIIDTLDTPLFVAAGAGSGKSATLAERVAHALTRGSGEDGAPYIDSLSQALVITYTHAAADEIREKIRTRLRQDPQLAHHALDVDSAWISTIHGMCIRILKAHAFELGIDPELALISENGAAELLEQAVDDCVGAVESEREYAALRAAFDIRGRSSAAGDTSSTIIGMVKSIRAAAASGVDGFGSLVFPGISQPLSVRLDAYLGSCLAMEQLLDEKGFTSNPTNNAAHARLRAQIDSISMFLAGRDQSDAAACVCIDGLGALSGSAFRAKDLKDSWKELRSQLDGLAVSKELARCAPLANQLVGLAKKVEERFSALKRAQGLVDNQDLLRMTHRAFAEHPEIAALYSDRFKLVMVDEFQDTNEQQVQMISALSGEGAEHLCTVGDAQQSIYRFQGADVSVFINRGENVPNPCHRVLTTNFRSHADILSFVEQVCSHGIIERFMPLAPSSVRANRYKTPELPRITVELTSGATGTDSERREVSARQLATRVKAYLDAGGSAGDVVLLMGSLKHVQVYLDSLRALGIECVVSGGSTFTSTPEVGLVAALVDLLANPYATKTGLFPVLTGQIFYCDANDICLLATRDHEAVDERDERRFDKRQLAEGFLALIQDGPEALAASAAPSERLLVAADVLGRAFRRMCTWQLCDVLEGIVRESGWIARLEEQGPQGIAQAANVLAAIRFAGEIADRDSLGISRASLEFARWLEVSRQGLASLDTGAAGVVRVMTVHASKGLEFPVCAVAELWGSQHGSDTVVSENVGLDILAALVPSAAAKNLPEVCEMPASRTAPIEDWAAYLTYLHKHSEQAERGRLLYVALTRAQEALIVCASVRTTKSVNAQGTCWAPQLVSDTCTALFGSDLPPAGISSLPYGGSAPALVRHVVVGKAEEDEDGVKRIPCDSAGTFEFTEHADEAVESIELFDPSVADGIAEARTAAVPWKPRTGVFSYSSVHALLQQQGRPAEEAGEVGGPVYQRPAIIAEDEEELGAAPFTGDADKATNLGSAFHQLAQTMVECGEVPDEARLASAARTWELSRSQRARLAQALNLWAASSLRAETLGYAVRRAEVPFFLAVDSEFGDHLEGAIDLLCTNPGSEHALVVDYKTGDAGLTFEQIEARHAMQAGFYAEVLMRLGYTSVECAFVCVELDDGTGQPVVARYGFDTANPPKPVFAR